MTAPHGFELFSGRLDRPAQRALAAEALAAAAAAPPEHFLIPRGRRMSVAMTNCGPLGWVSDTRGYRYEASHPRTGAPWPAIPAALMALWRELVSAEIPPDACLVNIYDARARMGMHRDCDEADFSIPVLSVSLGDTAVFRIGGLTRSAPSERLLLRSGDVCLLAGDSRLAFHGVDRIDPGTSDILPGGGRINLTLRRAAPAGPPKRSPS